ncbi:CinA family protein [uncultured Microbacterium sp.]|uniref:CinA family protein n=1 Tax=uncultured Microbacterium sp. TaxID=191216 RepID=UPI0025DDFA03|nr:CinA family protein [uncultured Microbacterium sp.]
MTLDTSDPLAVDLLAQLREREWTIGVAESLTGGLLVASLVAVPGASASVRGGVTAYATPIKHSLLGVDESLLVARGAVDPEVAAQMALGARRALSVAGTPCDVGLSTTGVAGPEPQDGQPVGTVFVGIATPDEVAVLPLRLVGDRARIRVDTVQRALGLALATLRGRAADVGASEYRM